MGRQEEWAEGHLLKYWVCEDAGISSFPLCATTVENPPTICRLLPIWQVSYNIKHLSARSSQFVWMSLLTCLKQTLHANCFTCPFQRQQNTVRKLPSSFRCTQLPTLPHLEREGGLVWVLMLWQCVMNTNATRLNPTIEKHLAKLSSCWKYPKPPWRCQVGWFTWSAWTFGITFLHKLTKAHLLYYPHGEGGGERATSFNL